MKELIRIVQFQITSILLNTDKFRIKGFQKCQF